MMALDRRAVLAGAAGMAALAIAPAGIGQTPVPGRPPPRPLPDAGRQIARAGLSGRVAHALVDPDTGDLLDRGNAALQMPPASTMKALTALYALSRLGPRHRFRTRVLRAGDMLVLAGGGDPVLDTDALARLADQLVATRPAAAARFAVWAGALPHLDEIAPEQDDHLAYNPALSGMILNFNRVHLGWRHDQGAIRMSLEARARSLSPRAYTIEATAREQSEPFRHRYDGMREQWSIARSALRGPGGRWLPVRRPALYAGDVFQTLCRARGLVLPAPEVIAELPAGPEIASLDSAPLADLLRDMLLFSTNLTAEAIGLAASGAASLTASAAAMGRWLQQQSLGGGFVLRDHSGLARDSRVTAGGLARALVRAEGADDLRSLLKTDPLDQADKAPGFTVAAKTGTLNFVSNLAGQISGATGRRAGFAILCADEARHQATSGAELPEGVLSWTRDAKALQAQLLAGWNARFLQDPVADLR